MEVSIIICTRDNARSLYRTLDGFSKVRVPAGWRCELLVVDNGSKDETEAVAREAKLSNFSVAYGFEERLGQSFARNFGLRNAQGQVILFTDDDLLPHESWLHEMVSPIKRGECDAVVGRTELCPELRRDWMEECHLTWLAGHDIAIRGEPELVGANMGFSRAVLTLVPGFDPELGPGATGFADDSLFSWQLLEAKFRIKRAPNAIMYHYPDRSRLLRRQWLKAAEGRGRGGAYILHHWEHEELSWPLFRSCWLTTKLWARRFLQPPPALDDEGCPLWELSYVKELAMCRSYSKERRRVRNYSKRGLTRHAWRTEVASEQQEDGSCAF